MMSNDDGLPNLVRLELGALPDVRLFRNNVGVLQDRNGSYVAYGLCVGSSDLVCVRSRIITPEMVGLKIGQAGFLEAKKRKGHRRPEQIAFINQMQHMGALAGFVESVEEARKILLL